MSDGHAGSKRCEEGMRQWKSGAIALGILPAAKFALPCAAKKTPSGEAGRFVFVARTHALPGRKTPVASRAGSHAGRHAGGRLEAMGAGSRIAHCNMLTADGAVSQPSGKTPTP
jgi:hypothetical protein